LVEKLLTFIFTLGGSFSGFILCGTFTPIAMGYSCPLIIIIFKGFKNQKYIFKEEIQLHLHFFSTIYWNLHLHNMCAYFLKYICM
jgi:hypothetical protein